MSSPASREHRRWKCGLVALSLLLSAAGFALAEDTVATLPEAKADDLLADLGTRSRAVELGYGWSRTERDGHRRFRWTKRLEADVWFEAGQAVDTDFWLVAAPLYLGYRRQNVGLYLNDQFITEWVCPDSSEFAVYHTVLPAEALVEGRNRLILRAGYKIRMGRDTRELALAVDKLLFRPRLP